MWAGTSDGGQVREASIDALSIRSTGSTSYYVDAHTPSGMFTLQDTYTSFGSAQAAIADLIGG